MRNYEAAIARFRKVIARLQMQENDDSQNGARVRCAFMLADTLLQWNIVQTTKLKHLRYIRKSLIVS